MRNLRDLNPTQLIAALGTIPASVASLDLSGRKLYRLSAPALATVFSAMPENIQEATLALSDIKDREKWELSIIQKAFQNTGSVRFVDDSGN